MVLEWISRKEKAFYLPVFSHALMLALIKNGEKVSKALDKFALIETFVSLKVCCVKRAVFLVGKIGCPQVTRQTDSSSDKRKYSSFTGLIKFYLTDWLSGFTI